MSADKLAVPPDRPEAGGSLRVRVARTALQAALQAPGVVGSDPGPSRLRVTADPPADPLVGVSAIAQADGRYAIDLSLVADLVPLPALAEEVRERVRKRTQGERLEDLLGLINVEFAYVVTREELAAAAAEREAEEARAAEKLASTATRPQEPPRPIAAASAPAEARGEALTGRGEEPPGGGEAGRAEPFAEAMPGGDAAALATRQAALATDQAALAAKQAALAAEQATLVAGPGTAVPPHSRERNPQEEK